ncbi:hypothetical protein [Kordiimonas sp. SCSIO 12610]|uniref:hypothetical protein n=1 Tax=Kordiimonas sp. SCSIO 12610 TaxID=2829597 RepID=UPI002109BCC7|nr:hypothetical protein [Kordiimonas sp. SCSIO 12610]UTW55260.1 hypothetical protein KFF44_15870 [Kordiimonas sp. SCSIO 12610]
MQFPAFLHSPKTTLWAFITTVIISISFVLVMGYWDFVVIDEIIDIEQLRHHISELTSTQRSVHTWATLTLDVLYPFAYASLFISLALRAFKDWGKYFALPSLICIPTDLTEGIIQVLLLNDIANLYALKVNVTALKFTLFGVGFLVAIIALVKLCVEHIKKKAARD